jgi:polyphosphate kinase 2
MSKKHNNDGESKLDRKQYEKELRRLQGELCTLQAWVKAKGLRVIVVFEGRDGAGKGGTIRAMTERVSPRVFRVVALPAPSDREKSQMYMQRNMQHFPAAGEIVIFDRSRYNRAGVEHVMGFCTKAQHRHFLKLCPEIEKYVVDGGIILLKYWLEVSNEEQERRFLARIEDPLRQWKLSPVPTSDAFVVAPGGIGTVLETMMIRQLPQVNHLTDTPLILAVKMWPGLLERANPVETLRGEPIELGIRNVVQRRAAAQGARQLREPDAGIDLLQRRIAYLRHGEALG